MLPVHDTGSPLVTVHLDHNVSSILSKQPSGTVSATPPSMNKRRRTCQKSCQAPAANPFLSWANSYKKVSKWFAQHDLEDQLDRNGGLVQLHDFLPADVAEGALEVVQQVPEVCLHSTLSLPRLVHVVVYMHIVCFMHSSQCVVCRQAGMQQLQMMM